MNDGQHGRGRGWRWFDVYSVVILSIMLLILGLYVLFSLLTVCFVLISFMEVIPGAHPVVSVIFILAFAGIAMGSFALMLGALRRKLRDLRGETNGEK